MLTQQQKKYFDVFGFLHLPQLFIDDIATIKEHFLQVFREHSDSAYPWEHVVHQNKPRLIMPALVEKSEPLKRLATEGVLAEIVGDLLGDGFQLLGSDGNIYDCGTRWHTDIVGLPYNCGNVKLIFYFDEMRAGEDAFRIIPGSHHHVDQFAKKLKQHIKTPEETVGVSMDEIPCCELATKPGDLVVFDARAWHAVAYAGRRRHMMSLLYADRDYKPPAAAAPVENSYD